MKAARHAALEIEVRRLLMPVPDARRPGSNGCEARTPGSMPRGVDYLKCDWCSTDGVDPKIAYTTMRDALRATGRPIVFSMCEWGRSQPATWARGVAHLWRTTGDILPCWDCSESWGGHGWSRILDMQVGLEKYAGPGGWNDPDMLQVGNPGLSTAENRAHFSFWVLLAAPLMAGNDVRQMSPEVREILLNQEVISVNQDPLGRQGKKIRDDGDLEVWSKPLQGEGRAVILFNRGKADATSSVSWRNSDSSTTRFCCSRSCKKKGSRSCQGTRRDRASARRGSDQSRVRHSRATCERCDSDVRSRATQCDVRHVRRATPCDVHLRVTCSAASSHVAPLHVIGRRTSHRRTSHDLPGPNANRHCGLSAGGWHPVGHQSARIYGTMGGVAAPALPSITNRLAPDRSTS
jgi:hypothetical protein